jgi:hypothetical protein
VPRKFLLILFVLLQSCASVPDVYVCTQLDINRGWCTKTISDEEFIVERAEGSPLKLSWWAMRNQMIMLPPESWAKIKAFVIKKCRKNKECGETWEKRLDNIDKKLE